MSLEDPKTIRKLWIGFYVVLGLLVLADPKLLELVHILEHDPHHAAHFIVDGWPEFYPIYGFVCCVVMVVVSKKLVGALLMRPDTYYDHSPLDPTRDQKGRRLSQ
ncbi:hypothetical protein G6O69_31630 [Pseudenhygromyxa sp. WMMC2535]|uniref:hypothetical protein n=1 Tax=Pseudenhygromyxa sp. WMMC2535 TaxID=2712867 RepID=UPI001556A6FA|nr:hypothetical protein [Pseudenhygromyxa sp. WMMC2535]NVB42417.1 hypothetical protein [Pseudenhygromyxa sp. WMMC2535]